MSFGNFSNFSAIGRLALLVGVMGDHRNGCYGIPFPDVDELHALSGTSGNTDGVNRHSDGHTAAADNHEVVFVGDVLDRYQLSGLFRDVQGSYALGTAGGLAVIQRV